MGTPFWRRRNGARSTQIAGKDERATQHPFGIAYLIALLAAMIGFPEN